MTEARPQLSDERILELHRENWYWNDFARAIIAADRALAGVEATEGQQWISVETRLPELEALTWPPLPPLPKRGELHNGCFAYTADNLMVYAQDYARIIFASMGKACPK